MAMDMSKCKMTVLQRRFHKELVDEFMKDPEGFAPCERFREGQEFILESPFEMPEGFCPWAWGDLRHEVLALTTGSDMPWMKQSGTSIMGCTDWFRPVIFKVERIG